MEAYGAPEVLRAVERPDESPGEGEVVVRSVVSGVNRSDVMIRAGTWPQGGGFPYVPGLEVAGTVERVGPGVTGFSVGDSVITMMQRLGGVWGTRAGGYQSHVKVPAATLAKVPASIDAATAGRYGLPAVTALLALELLQVRAGERVLVHAASSAVGQIATQLCALQGAYVLGTGTRAEKLELTRRRGVHQTVLTREPGWSKGLQPVDKVFDLVGSATFRESVERMAPGGRLVFVGGLSGGAVTFDAWALMEPITLTGYSSESLTRMELQRAIDGIGALHSAGRLALHAVTEVPLARAADAHREMESGRLQGRVVLVP
jgi:NADPH2:quinone reductase